MCSGLLLLAQVFKLNTDVLSHYLFSFLKLVLNIADTLVHARIVTFHKRSEII